MVRTEDLPRNPEGMRRLSRDRCWWGKCRRTATWEVETHGLYCKRHADMAIKLVRQRDGEAPDDRPA